MALHESDPLVRSGGVAPLPAIGDREGGMSTVPPPTVDFNLGPQFLSVLEQSANLGR